MKSTEQVLREKKVISEILEFLNTSSFTKKKKYALMKPENYRKVMAATDA